MDLLLYAQPVCAIGTGRLVFEELLLRLRGRGCVTGPGELLARAEREGNIAEIDTWVVRESARIAGQGRPISVNVSAHSVSDPGFLGEVVQVLDLPLVDPRLYTLEITETAVMSDLIQASRFAEHLRSHGCSFALDDFGTGYAPLTYLKHLPFRYLKIDMSFVRDLVEDPRNQAVVRGIVALAHGFGLETVAEGVEDEPTLELLGRLGVDLAQGWFIGAPAQT